mmetsp:Transcript_115615/g.361637  ORF Transcript_115615/g.361637 Transcript_115615/m.361637 type:complete len:298 (-) Transcript_115615:150-1043(-)
MPSIRAQLLPLLLVGSAGFRVVEDDIQANGEMQGSSLGSAAPTAEELQELVKKSSKPGPQSGECAVHDVDNYKPADGEKCYVYMYGCSGRKKPMGPAEHNTGDVAWALTHEGSASSCRHYGKYLHIWQVEVAKAAMWRNHYEQCNYLKCKQVKKLKLQGCRGGLSVCGCGLEGERCGGPQQPQLPANNFGWRIRNFAYGISYQFSLPSRAMGPVDAARAYDFAVRRPWASKPPDRSEDAAFQFNTSAEMPLSRVVNIDKCLKKHVWKKGQTEEEAVAAFQRHVLGEVPSKGCAAKTA